MRHPSAAARTTAAAATTTSPSALGNGRGGHEGERQGEDQETFAEPG
jgi:hypothetical protein